MKIGIFWFFSDKIIGIAHEFNSNEKDSIGLIDSKYTHVEYWERIKADIPELRYMEYDEVQRGRVIFDINKNKLIIYLDKKLLIKGKVSKICEFFDAEYDVNTVLRLDPHYRT